MIGGNDRTCRTIFLELSIRHWGGARDQARSMIGNSTYRHIQLKGYVQVLIGKERWEYMQLMTSYWTLFLWNVKLPTLLISGYSAAVESDDPLFSGCGPPNSFDENSHDFFLHFLHSIHFPAVLQVATVCHLKLGMSILYKVLRHTVMHRCMYIWLHCIWRITVISSALAA